MDQPPNFLPDILHQPAETVHALQDGLLRRMVEICYDSHPFYGRLMRREGLEPRHIQTCADLVRLPPASKADFLADPDAFRLDPAKLPAREGTLWKVVYTTGTTTGRPAPVYVAAHDHFAYMFGSFQDRQDMIGLRDTDRLINLFPLTNFPLGAFARSADEVAAVGAAIVFGHTGRAEMGFPLNRSMDAAVEAVTRHRVTVLWGVAGFVRRVLIRAKDLGADFSSVRMVMTTGEAASPAMRADFRRRMADLGCADTVIVNRYGSTEQGRHHDRVHGRQRLPQRAARPTLPRGARRNRRPTAGWRARPSRGHAPQPAGGPCSCATSSATLPRWTTVSARIAAAPRCGCPQARCAPATSSRSRVRWSISAI